MLLEGLNRIRDLISDDIDNGQLGTGTATLAESNTSLTTEDTDTNLAITNTNTSKQIQFDYTLPSTGGNTATYTEFELRKDATPVNYDRILFTGYSFTKNGSEDLNISKRYFIKRV